MIDGDWGSKFDIIMAGAAVLAFLFSVISLLWNWLLAKHQQDWEEEQRLKQNKWLEGLDQEQAKRETA